MTNTYTGPAVGHRLTVIDQDPLRARKEVRELLTALSEAGAQAALDIPRQRTTAASGSDKGSPVTDLISLVFSGGSLVAAAIQIWLARVPQRTVVITRRDGTTLRISGQDARADHELVTGFLGTGDTGPAPDAGNDDSPGENGPTAR